MVTSDTLEPVEERRSTLFLVGGAMFGVAAALTVVAMVTDAPELAMLVGEAFIALGWIAGLVGLVGFYPSVVDRNHWLARAGVVFAAVGVVTFLLLAAASVFAAVSGGQLGDLPVPVVLFLPGVIVGSFLAFVTFSVACFRSEVHSRRLSLLLLVPTGIFVTNFLILPLVLGAGPNPPAVGFVVTGALTLALLAIGYVLRAEDVPTEQAGQVAGRAAK